jgi:purine-binding chemotaxis protein CheW
MTLHIVFVVAGSEYALPVDVILQMESFTGATKVPGVSPYVVGVVTVRGRVVPVIDLRLRFGQAAAEDTLDTRIAVTELGERVVALRVDSAREVLKLDPEKHQPAPKVVSERSQGFVRAVHSLGSRLLLLLDLPKVLGETSHDDEPHPLLDDGGFQRRPALTG